MQRLRVSMQVLIKWFFAIVIIVNFGAVDVVAEDITVYEDCLKGDYTKLVDLQKQYKALQNENFNNYTLKDWTPGKKFKSEPFELLCKMSSLPSWATTLCGTYSIGQKYNEISNKNIINEVNKAYRKYLIYLKTYEFDQCTVKRDKIIKPVTLTEVKTALDQLAVKDKNNIMLLMLKGWKDYCNKLNDVKKKIAELKDRCVQVPNVIGENLLDACANLYLSYLTTCTSDLPNPNSNDKGKSHWEVYKQYPKAGTFVNKFANIHAHMKTKNILTNLKILPSKPILLEAGKEVKIKSLLKLKASFKAGKNIPMSKTHLLQSEKSTFDKDVTVDKNTVWQSENKNIVIIHNGTIKVLPNAKAGEITKLTATYSSFGISKNDSVTIKIKASKKIKIIPIDPLLIKSISKSIKIKAYEVFSDTSQKEITKSMKTSWSATQPSVNFYVKGEMNIGYICDNKPIKVTATYDDNGKIYRSNTLLYKIDPTYTYVPWLVGQNMDKNKAIRLIKKNRLIPVIIENNSCDNQYKINEVVEQDPLFCNVVKKGTKVKIFVNTCLSTRKVKVPNFVGIDLKKAGKVAKNVKLGLQISFSDKLDARSKPGTIFSQQPTKGTYVPFGTLVSVKVNPKMLEVPDLICMTQNEARNAVLALGLKLQVNMASSFDSQCKKEEIIEQTPQKGKKILQGSNVSVLLNPASKPLIGIKIREGEKLSYPLGTTLTFIADIKRKTKGNSYKYIWHIDGKKVGEGERLEHTFKDPGSHYIMLDMVSSDPSENDTIRKYIGIDYPPEITCSFEWTAVPPPGATTVFGIGGYLPNTGFTFSQTCLNAKNVTEYRWYVDDHYIGSGTTSSAYAIKETGRHVIRLGLRKKSNFDELKCENTIKIGENPVDPLGRYRNRFKAKGGLNDLSVCSEYWVGGLGKWSDQCKKVSDIGKVEGYKLCTGDQSDGWNTGFLAYKKQNNSGKLSFQVYHFKFGDTYGDKFRGILHYSGDIYESRNPDPNSIETTCHANMVEVNWQNEDGSECNTKIWKFKSSKMLAHSGIEKSVCSKPVISHKKLKFCKKFAKSAVKQYQENIQRGCNLSGYEWHDREEDHKKWCLKASKKKADDLTKYRTDALKSCGKTWCDSYAEQAVEQNKENLRKQCHFKGRHWQSDYDNHYNWCRTKSKNVANSELRKRDQLLKNCTRQREGPCQAYADKAVRQNKQNIHRDCGYYGQRWQSNYDNHFQWCLGQKQNEQNSETKEREKLLRQCGYTNPDNTNPVCRIVKPKSGIVVQIGKYVHFKAEASDKDKDKLKYIWKFEGGYPATGESKQRSSITTQWKNSGIYKATLTVIDKKGGSCTDVINIFVDEKVGNQFSGSNSQLPQDIPPSNGGGVSSNSNNNQNITGGSVQVAVLGDQPSGNIPISQNNGGGIVVKPINNSVSNTFVGNPIYDQVHTFSKCYNRIGCGSGDFRAWTVCGSKQALTVDELSKNANHYIEFKVLKQSKVTTVRENLKKCSNGCKAWFDKKVSEKWQYAGNILWEALPGEYRVIIQSDGYTGCGYPYTQTSFCPSSCRIELNAFPIDKTVKPKSALSILTNKLQNKTNNINSNIENKATYLGCYIDKPDRDIKGYHFNHGQMTNKICINTCREKGFGVAATQFSTHCFCGNSFGNYGKAPKQDECNYKCKGNEKTNCGGYWRNSVYQIGEGGFPEVKVPPPSQPSGNSTTTGNTHSKPGVSSSKTHYREVNTNGEITITTFHTSPKGVNNIAYTSIVVKDENNKVYIQDPYKTNNNPASKRKKPIPSNHFGVYPTEKTGYTVGDLIDAGMNGAVKSVSTRYSKILSGSNAKVIGDKLKVTLHLKLNNLPAGKKYIYARTVDLQSVDSGWKKVGEFTVIENTASPTANSDTQSNKPVSTTQTLRCPSSKQQAYHLYTNNYNELQKLMRQGHGDIPEAQVFYKKYKFYKDCYGTLATQLNHDSDGTVSAAASDLTATTPILSQTVYASADAYVYAYNYRNWNRSNRGRYDQLVAGWHPTGGESRAYINFDLSGIGKSKISKAILKLYHFQTSGNNGVELGIYRVTSPWNEGSDTYHSGRKEKTAPPGDISWVQQPKIDSAPIATFNPGTGMRDWTKVDISSLVKQWLSGTPNYGLVIKPIGHLGRNISVSTYHFASRERDQNLDKPKDENKSPVLILSRGAITNNQTLHNSPKKTILDNSDLNKDTLKKAYQTYIATYNRLADLAVKRQGKTKEGKEALLQYKKAKKHYEKLLANKKAEKKTSNTVENQSSASKAYHEYMDAYQKLQKLTHQGKDDTLEAQMAYKNYKKSKDRYEAEIQKK